MELYEILCALWRKKWLLAAISIVPSLALGLYLYLSPRVYKARIEYNIQTDSVSLRKIHTRFYSQENLKRIIERLRHEGMVDIPAKLNAAEGEEDLKAMIRIRATPDYIDFGNKQNLKISLAKSWAENVEKLEKLTAEILSFEIKGKPMNEVETLARVVQTNFEKELPLYDLRDALAKKSFELNNELSSIEGNREPLKIALEEIKKTLAGLKEISPGTDSGLNGVNLHYQNPAQEARFLPLSLQIQAAASEVNRVTRAIEAADRRHEYFSDLKNLLNQLRQALAPGSETSRDLDSYHTYVTGLLAKTESPGALDYLKLHLNQIGNQNLSRIALTGESRVQPMARGTIRRTAFAFAVFAILGIFFVSLMDFLRRYANRTERATS